MATSELCSRPRLHTHAELILRSIYLCFLKLTFFFIFYQIVTQFTGDRRGGSFLSPVRSFSRLAPESDRLPN